MGVPGHHLGADIAHDQVAAAEHHGQPRVRTPPLLHVSDASEVPLCTKENESVSVRHHFSSDDKR